MKRFLINKNGVYYLTTGKLFEYNEKAAGGHSGKEQGVKDTMAEFVKRMNSPTTMYGAVEVDDASFPRPMNTGEVN